MENFIVMAIYLLQVEENPPTLRIKAETKGPGSMVELELTQCGF